jgi:hypothetical protein
MEDFSDTKSLFSQHPEKLKVISERRYAAMQKIYKEFMPFYSVLLQPAQERAIEADDMLNQQDGRSPEEVRRAYLAHENE